MTKPAGCWPRKTGRTLRDVSSNRLNSAVWPPPCRRRTSAVPRTEVRPTLTRGSLAMWITEFCARRSSDCVEQAEACGDAERRQAWLRLAGEWAQVPEEAIRLDRVNATRAGEALETEPREAAAA